MARSKQADERKVNRGDKKPSLDDVVEGTAFEKETVDPAGQTGGPNGPARPSTTTRVSGLTMVSLIISLVAVAGVAFLYYKINTDTGQAISARDKALAEFYDVLGDRLDAVDWSGSWDLPCISKSPILKEITDMPKLKSSWKICFQNSRIQGVELR